MMRHRLLLRGAITLVVLAAVGGGILGYRNYKIHRVEKETLRFLRWLKRDVLDVNPIKVVEVFGRNEPDWLGLTNLHVLLQSPTGAEFTVNALIDSTLSDTRLVQLELYYSGLRAEELTVEEMADALQHPPGTKVDLPVEVLDSDRPIDLRQLLPAAFTRPSR